MVEDMGLLGLDSSKELKTDWYGWNRVTVYLRPVLREGSHQQAAVRLAAQERVRGCEPYR